MTRAFPEGMVRRMDLLVMLLAMAIGASAASGVRVADGEAVCITGKGSWAGNWHSNVPE